MSIRFDALACDGDADEDPIRHKSNLESHGDARISVGKEEQNKRHTGRKSKEGAFSLTGEEPYNGAAKIERLGGNPKYAQTTNGRLKPNREGNVYLIEQVAAGKEDALGDTNGAQQSRAELGGKSAGEGRPSS